MVIFTCENNCGSDYFPNFLDKLIPICARAPSFVTLRKVIVKCWEGILSSCLERGETRLLHDTEPQKRTIIQVVTHQLAVL